MTLLIALKALIIGHADAKPAKQPAFENPRQFELPACLVELKANKPKTEWVKSIG